MLLLETDRDSFLKPLQAVTGIVERRHTLPILSNVLIERVQDRLTFITTDLELQISTAAPCLDHAQDFSLTVSAKKLQDICRALPEGSPLKLHGLDGRVQVKAGKSQFSLQTLPAEDFPRLSPIAESGEVIRIPQKDFKDLIGLVQYAMAQQDIRYYLNGLLLVMQDASLTLVATDGHRLSLASAPLPSGRPPQEVILPRKTVTELGKLLTDTEDDLILEIGQNQVKFTFGTISLVSKIVDGKFPDYTRVIPSGHTKSITLPRLALLHALQRAAILSNEKFKGVRLVLTNNSLSIICNNNEQEEAQVELEVSYAGEALDIGFNVTYLLDVLANLTCDEVTWEFGDANSSAVVTIPQNPDFKYVVMPMRI